MNFQLATGALFPEVKGERGISMITFVPPAYVIQLPFAHLVDVTPGQETAVSVAMQDTPLPPNANVGSVKAWVHVGDATSTPAPASTGVSITPSPDPKNASGTYKVAVDQPTRPRNVQLKLEGGQPFWTFGGVLAEEQYQLPDFSQALNAYLDKLKSTTPLSELKFVFKSDTPGKVGIEIKDLQFSQIKTQSWSNPLDQTTRVDRNVTLSFGDVQRWNLDALTDGSHGQVQIQSVRLDASGQFGPDRLLGAVEVHDGKQLATISGDYSLAQDFTLSSKAVKGSHRCTGITCFFKADDKAELYVELQRDANGYPASDSPLAKANLTFTPPEKKGDPQPWTFAKFGSPAELNTDVRYWVIVKGVRGSARLGLQAVAKDGTAPVVRQQVYVNRGGQVWKPMFRINPDPPVVALLGVVYLPGSDDQTAAVQIVMTNTSGTPASHNLPVDPVRTPKTVSLDGVQGKSWNQSVLEVRSHGQGTLTVANVIQEYSVPK